MRNGEVNTGFTLRSLQTTSKSLDEMLKPEGRPRNIQAGNVNGSLVLMRFH